ncbi:Aldo/keto reductase [Gyrodon lividus]|nr:Aldo/keto reductase [Gyrodon lividus]
MPTIGFGVFENPECADACEFALKTGYRMIDSARYYQNEAQVGEGVRRTNIPRENIFITSKIYHPDFGYEKTLDSVRESVEQLGFGELHEVSWPAGCYDLYLIHSPHGGPGIRLATYKALLKAKSDGLIRSVGYTKSTAQVLIRWSLQKGHVPLPKSSSPSRIEENFKVFDFSLEEEDMTAIDALDEGAGGAVTWNPVDQL